MEPNGPLNPVLLFKTGQARPRSRWKRVTRKRGQSGWTKTLHEAALIGRKFAEGRSDWMNEREKLN